VHGYPLFISVINIPQRVSAKSRVHCKQSPSQPVILATRDWRMNSNSRARNDDDALMAVCQRSCLPYPLHIRAQPRSDVQLDKPHTETQRPIERHCRLGFTSRLRIRCFSASTTRSNAPLMRSDDFLFPIIQYCWV